MLIKTDHATYTDTQLTAWMIEDFQRDPILAMRVLLGVRKLPPHEVVRIWGMWTSATMVDSSGYSTGKTFCIAAVSAIRLCVFEERYQMVLSKTFIQGQRIFDYYDRWAAQKKLFVHQLMVNKQNQPSLTHGGSAWVATGKNGNTIRAVPPDWQRNAERLGSERVHDLYVDEWVKIGNFLALNKIVVGRATHPLHDAYEGREDEPIFRTHMYYGSTADYQWNPAYQRVKYVQNKVAGGDSAYEYQSWCYKDIPEAHAWMVDKVRLDDMRENLPEDVWLTEGEGVWVKDSLGWYSAEAIEEAQTERCPILLAAV